MLWSVDITHNISKKNPKKRKRPPKGGWVGLKTSAPRGGERATVCLAITAVRVGVRKAGCSGEMRMGRAGKLLADGTAKECRW